MKTKLLRKNGGLIRHWLYLEGANKDEAMCGETIARKKKRSYWVGSSDVRKMPIDSYSCETCRRMGGVDGRK